MPLAAARRFEAGEQTLCAGDLAKDTSPELDEVLNAPDGLVRGYVDGKPLDVHAGRVDFSTAGMTE